MFTIGQQVRVRNTAKGEDLEHLEMCGWVGIVDSLGQEAGATVVTVKFNDEAYTAVKLWDSDDPEIDPGWGYAWFTEDELEAA